MCRVDIVGVHVLAYVVVFAFCGSSAFWNDRDVLVVVGVSGFVVGVLGFGGIVVVVVTYRCCY